MMSGLQFYKTYTSLSLHFQSNYDILKYGKAKNLTPDSYSKRKDRLKFESYAQKIQDERAAFYFCTANFMHNGKNWFYEPYADASDIYKQWKKYFDAFDYNFKQEFANLKKVLNDYDTTFEKMLLQTTSGNNPPLLQLLLAGKLSPEFVCKMDAHFQFIDTWYDMYAYSDPYIQDKLFRLKKYTPLVNMLRKEIGK